MTSSGDAEALARYRAASRRHRADPASAPNLTQGSRRRLLRSVSGTPSGPRPDARDPQRVGALWRSLADAAGWTNEMALWSLTNRWAEIVGPQVAEHVKVIGFDPNPAGDAPVAASRKSRRQPQQQALLPDPVSTSPPATTRTGGKLMLGADSDSWQQQMIWNLVHLQRRLDDELGSGVVATIVVLGPPTRRRRYS